MFLMIKKIDYKRESAVLFDNQKSLLEDEFFVLLVTCHEISHSVSKLNLNSPLLVAQLPHEIR